MRFVTLQYPSFLQIHILELVDLLWITQASREALNESRFNLMNV